MAATTENEVAKEIVDAAVKVHRALGPGLLELVYEIVLAYELKRRGLPVIPALGDPNRVLSHSSEQ